MKEIRDKLSELLVLLREGDEKYQANQIEDALAGSEKELKSYVTSNELWGGAGSVADQALVEDRPSRKKVEAVLAELGEIQKGKGMVNARTERWTSAFREWQRKTI